MSEQVKLGSQEDQREAQVYIQNKNVTAMWLLLITQLFYCFMYGFFIRINTTNILSSQAFVHTALLFVLIIAGFGLVLSNPYKLVWSNLGFNLLITALAVQTYFLVNAFWTKAAVFFAGSKFGISEYVIALVPVPYEAGPYINGAHLNQAIKCSLACIVAFSFVIGRAGLLQLYWMTVTGTAVYELIRQICLNNFPIQIGSIKIFLFGGVFGLMTSLVLNRLGRQANTIEHYNNWSNRPTAILSLLGTLICWALFPLLTRQNYLLQTSQTINTRVISVVLAMSSAALLGVFLGYVRFGFRSVTLSLLGAGVAILSSTAYISNPVYAIVFGLSSAIAQFLFLFINSKLKVRFGPLDPNAYVFIGQGFLGLFFQTINRQIVQTNSNSLAFDWNTTYVAPEYILGNGAITIAIALVLGFVLGALLSCCNYHQQVDHFTDFTYWLRGDGLTKNQPQVVKVQQEAQQPEFQIYIRQTVVQVKQKNAYL